MTLSLCKYLMIILIFFGRGVGEEVSLNLSMPIVTSCFMVSRMHIDKVNWITAHDYGKPKCHSFSPSFKLKMENMGARHCLTKCALESKLLNQNC